MSSYDMPSKREFHVLPKPQAVAKFVIRSVILLFCAGLLLFAAKFLYGHAFGSAGEAEAATPAPAKSIARQILQEHAPAPAPVAAVAPRLTDEQFEQLRADVCHSLGKEFVFEDGHCFKPRPKAWSGEGITERGAQGHPLAEAAELARRAVRGLTGAAAPAEEPEEAAPPPPPPRERAVSRMASESESWHPQLRLQGHLHEPGEPCPGGGHRDSAGFMCVFTDEERAALRERRRY